MRTGSSRRLWISSLRLWLPAFFAFTWLLAAQGPQLQEQIAAIKHALAANKQELAQYTWVEQDTIILKGEEKKQDHFQVRLGPDGKPQKTSLDAPQADPAGHQGRL